MFARANRVRYSPQMGVPSDHNCSRASRHSDVVSLYYLQRSAISAGVIRFRHVTKELFSSVIPFLLLQSLLRPKPTRDDLKLPVDPQREDVVLFFNRRRSSIAR